MCTIHTQNTTTRNAKTTMIEFIKADGEEYIIISPLKGHTLIIKFRNQTQIVPKGQNSIRLHFFRSHFNMFE